MQTTEKVLKPGQVANILDYYAKCPLVLLPSKPNIHKKTLCKDIEKWSESKYFILGKCKVFNNSFYVCGVDRNRVKCNTLKIDFYFYICLQ